MAIPRLSLSSTGKVVYTLKTPYRNGTTQVAFEGAAICTVDFIARLAALARARSGQNRVSTSPANQGATCHAVFFRREENRVSTVQSVGTPLKTPWHGLLRIFVQEWTNMNCAITSANNFSGQSAVIWRIYPVQPAVSVRKSTPNSLFTSILENAHTGHYHAQYGH